MLCSIVFIDHIQKVTETSVMNVLDRHELVSYFLLRFEFNFKVNNNQGPVKAFTDWECFWYSIYTLVNEIKESTVF